jgi:hypothetical protein
MTQKKRTLPNNVSEEEFLQVLENISNRLANKFKFAYHNTEDMKQQAAIFALEGLENYDRSRPLENFLWTHVRNRLFNFKRNNYQRPDKPCYSCPFFDAAYKNSTNQCEKYVNKNDCELYKNWTDRNEAKKNIIQPGSIGESNHLAPSNTDSVENKELIDFLDTFVQLEYRENYLKLKHGIKLNKSDLKKLQSHIQNLMENHNWNLNHRPKKEDN